MNTHTNTNNSNHYDYIVNLLSNIIYLVKCEKYKGGVFGFGTTYPKSIETIIHNYNKPRFTNMETTVKLIISEIAYINDIYFTDTDLNEVYTILTSKKIKNNDSRKPYEKLLFPLNEDDSHMRYLITIMSYIDATMAKGKSKSLPQFDQLGLKGSAFTAGNIKQIDYHHYIDYLIGIHGFLLGRFFTFANIEKCKKIINKESIKKNNIDKYLSKNNNSYRKATNKRLENPENKNKKI